MPANLVPANLVPANLVPASYLALADSIEAEIALVRPGVRLPSEHQLCASHEVSRVTARSALQELERRHLVRRTLGSGTFTALRMPYPIRPGTSPSWSQIVRAAGHEPSYRIIDVDHVRGEPATVRALLLAPATDVVRIVRVGSIDGEPAAHQTMHFPLDTITPSAAGPGAVAQLLAEHPSTTALLADHAGIQLERAVARTDLRPIDTGRAAELELTGRPMAWRTETVNRCRHSHRPVEHTEAWLRADCFEVFMEIGPSDGLPPFTSSKYTKA